MTAAASSPACPPRSRRPAITALTLAPDSLPDCLLVNARAPDGTIQGLRHESLPVHGVQFHPESIASAHGHALLEGFLTLARTAKGAAPATA